MFRGTFAVFALALPATCATIISTSPAGAPCCGIPSATAEYESWSQTVTYTNVTITANLFDLSIVFQAGGLAYLTTQIGPGTTSSNEVAHVQFSISNGLSTPKTLFTGLTLVPGNYFLTIVNPSTISTDLGWDEPGGPLPLTVTEGTGVSQTSLPGAAGRIGPPPSYPPASNFSLQDQNFAIFTVAGNLSITSPTPEPATGAIALAALCGLVLVRRRNV
jgi:MYXO-CTERM domain-containing protein